MADISVSPQGSIILFRGLTDEGKRALQEDVSSESWQWLGSNLAVDHRPAHGLIDFLQDQGLELEVV